MCSPEASIFPSLCSFHADKILVLVPRSITIKGATCGFDTLLLVVITSIAGFLFGYDIGQISGILLFDNFNKFVDGDLAMSLIVSLMSVGCLVGSLLGA